MHVNQSTNQGAAPATARALEEKTTRPPCLTGRGAAVVSRPDQMNQAGDVRGRDSPSGKR